MALQAGEPVAWERLLAAEEWRQIADAFAQVSFGNLSGVRERLGGRYDYGPLRIYRAARPRRAGGFDPPRSAC